MSDDASETAAPPGGGWRVRILDLSGGAEEGITEEIGGFPDLGRANAFARAYVRDSVERCRDAGMTAREVLDRWFAFGEDAEVLEAGEAGWRSANELHDFADYPAADAERDWRALDPRREPRHATAASGSRRRRSPPPAGGSSDDDAA